MKMNKKAMQFTVVVIFAILLVFAFVFLIGVIVGPKSLLNKITIAAGKIGNKVFPEMTTKTGFEEGKNIPANKEALGAYNTVVNLFSDENKGQCIISYEEFPDDFNGYSIKVSKLREKDGAFIELFNKDGKVVESYEAENKHPCVLVGDASESFYTNWLANKPCSANCKPDYAEYSFDLTGNKLMVDNNKYDLGSHLVYKSMYNHICFIPIVSTFLKQPGCTISSDGLDKDCVESVKEKLPVCGLESDEQKDYFNKGTFYGKKTDWALKGVGGFKGYWYVYTGKDMRVAYTFKREGISSSEFDKVRFGIDAEDVPKGKGVYYRIAYKIRSTDGQKAIEGINNYWGKKEDWKYVEKDELGYSTWIYKGNEQEVNPDFKKIGISSAQKEQQLFGP